jgi:hypothetical protein
MSATSTADGDWFTQRRSGEHGCKGFTDQLQAPALEIARQFSFRAQTRFQIAAPRQQLPQR